MPLETGDHIPELDPNNPLGSDAVSLGDDHMRLIKRAVTGSFPAFVGTTATPKSVTLTEDQINDAALKSVDQTITGIHTHSAAIVLDNITPLQGKDIGGTPQQMLSMSAVDVITLGTSALESQLQAPNNVNIRVNFGTVADFVTSALGGITVQDRPRLGARKVGFRNPRRFAINANTPVLQDWEGQMVALNTGSLQIDFDALETGTKFTIICASGTNFFNDGAGATIQRFDGVARVDGDFTAPFAGVYNCWMPTSNLWYIWQIATVI